MAREPRWGDVWVVVEMSGGLPGGLWVCRSEASAERTAAEIAEEEGYVWSEDGFWVEGDSELHVRTGDLEPEGSG